MEQLNRIELRGNVGTAKISDYNGSKMARFTLATNFVSRNLNGETIVETTWHTVIAWESKWIPDLSFIEKGASVSVVGRVRNNNYTKPDGQELRDNEVLAFKVEKVTLDMPMQPASSTF